LDKYDLVIFYSPAGITSLKENFPSFDQGEKKIGAFGPATSKAVKEAGLSLDIEAPTPEAPSMAKALELFIKKNHKDNK
jgi:uroporphyrinogen-III synthase